MLDLSYSLKIKERYDRKGPGQPWTVGGTIKSVCVCMCVCVGGGGIGLANLWPCRTIEIDHAPGPCPPPPWLRLAGHDLSRPYCGWGWGIYIYGV